jgi:hypothetical protein
VEGHALRGIHMHVVNPETKFKKKFFAAPTCTGYKIIFSFHYKNFSNAF